MRALLLVTSLLLLSAVPAAGALPSPLGSEEFVSDHGMFDFAAQTSCTSSDPALGLLSTDLTSRLGHVTSGGQTTYTLHLDATTSADVACPAIDMTFTSNLVWEDPAQFAGGAWSMPCGAGGFLVRGQDSRSAHVQMGFSSLPAECGLAGVTTTSVLFFSTREVFAGSQVCTPVVFAGCNGPSEGTSPNFGACTQPDRYLNVDVAGFTLVHAAHRCEWWNGGAEYGQVSDGFDFVRIRGSPGSCEIILLGFVGGEQTVACPAEVGDALYAQDWHALV